MAGSSVNPILFVDFFYKIVGIKPMDITETLHVTDREA